MEARLCVNCAHRCKAFAFSDWECGRVAVVTIDPVTGWRYVRNTLDPYEERRAQGRWARLLNLSDHRCGPDGAHFLAGDPKIDLWPAPHTPPPPPQKGG